MRSGFFRRLCTLLALVLCMGVLLPTEPAAAADDGLVITPPGREEILAMYAAMPWDDALSDTYAAEPSTAAPYCAGRLSDASLQNSLNLVNFTRFVAGLPCDVTLREEFTDYAQHAALLNCVNGKLTHYPQCPDGYPQDLYEKGYRGASRGNLACRYGCLANSLIGYLDDSGSNIDTLGHRRWILSTSLRQTGFGRVGTHASMYVMSGSTRPFSGFVAWPAPQMPIEYLRMSGSGYPWSVSLGSDYAIRSVSDVRVQLEDLTGGRSWVLDASTRDRSGSYLTVNRDGYGDRPCIIFRPDPDTVSYAAGSRFRVTVTGIQTASGRDASIRYTVDMFSLGNPGQGPSSGQPAGWQKIGGLWYYCDAHGTRQVGWQKIDGLWYFFAADGAMQTGWVRDAGCWYYLAPSGAMRTGWLSEGGHWYYLAPSGAMRTGWVRTGGRWYYLASSGAMQTGWQKVDGKWYYMNSDGVMLSDCRVDGYWLTSDGSMQ